MKWRWQIKQAWLVTIILIFAVLSGPFLVVNAGNKNISSDVTITFWQSLAYPYVSSPITDIIKQFEKKHPHIHINLVNTGGYDATYIKTMQLDRLNLNQWPDVVMIYDIGLGGMALNNNIIPVSQFMKIDKNQFVRSAISYYTLWNTVYGLPFNSSVPVLYVNTTLLERYNINDIPSSLKNIVYLCNQTNLGSRAILTFPLHSWIVEELIAVEGIPLLNHNNGRNKPGTKLSTQAFVGIKGLLEYLKNLQSNKCLLLTSPKSWEEANQIFFDGKALMLITSSSDQKYIFNEMAKRGYKVEIYPMIGINQRNNPPVIGGAALYIIKKHYTPQQKEAIKTFVRYLTSYEAQMYISNNTGYLPVNIKAWNEKFQHSCPNTQTILETFIESGNNIANLGAVSPAMYKIRFVIENALDNLEDIHLPCAVKDINKKIVSYIANIEALIYKPHIIIIGSLSLMLILIAFTSYLVLLKNYEKFRNIMVWLSLPVVISIIATSYRKPIIYSIGMLSMSLIIAYGIFLLMRLYNKGKWAIIPILIETIFSLYYLQLAIKFYGLYIPSRIYIYMFTLLALPLMITLSIIEPNIFFFISAGSMALLPLSFYITYTTTTNITYAIVAISFLSTIAGIILFEKKKKPNVTIFRMTQLKLGIGTALLIVIIISVIPSFMYWKNIYDIAEAIENNTFMSVLKETTIDNQIGSLIDVSLKNDELKNIKFLTNKKILVIEGKKHTATIPIKSLEPFIQNNWQFYKLSLYDIKGHLVIGTRSDTTNTSFIVRPLSSTRSQLHLVATVYDDKITSYITSRFFKITLFGYYPLIIIFITVLLVFYLSSKRINDLLWDEVEAKTSEVFAMEENIKEAYNDLQKEHELLMLLIQSITQGHKHSSITDFLLDIGKRMQERSDEVKGFFIYHSDGTIIQSEVSVNLKNILKHIKSHMTADIIETDEGSFILTKLSTGHILGIALSKKTEYTNTIVEVMDAFASLLDTFINLEMLREKTEKMHTNILMALVGALDLKDPYTKGHSLHVAKAAIELGKALKLNEEELSKLYMAAILHDIGKISIPDNILGKPGKLTEEEYNIIKSHPVMGYKLLKSIEGLEEVSKIILYHHERCDGKGYPEGLTCEQIPMLAKIISIADAFDAMVNRRVYRKALSLDRVREEIKKNLGTQFDPYIGRKFLEIIDEVYDMIKEERENE